MISLRPITSGASGWACLSASVARDMIDVPVVFRMAASRSFLASNNWRMDGIESGIEHDGVGSSLVPEDECVLAERSRFNDLDRVFGGVESPALLCITKLVERTGQIQEPAGSTLTKGRIERAISASSRGIVRDSVKSPHAETKHSRAETRTLGLVDKLRGSIKFLEVSGSRRWLNRTSSRVAPRPCNRR